MEYEGDKDIKLSDMIKTIFFDEIHSASSIILFINGADIYSERLHNEVKASIVASILNRFNNIKFPTRYPYNLLKIYKPEFMWDVREYILNEMDGVELHIHKYKIFEYYIDHSEYDKAFAIVIDEFHKHHRFYPEFHSLERNNYVKEHIIKAVK